MYADKNVQWSNWQSPTGKPLLLLNWTVWATCLETNVLCFWIIAGSECCCYFCSWGELKLLLHNMHPHFVRLNDCCWGKGKLTVKSFRKILSVSKMGEKETTTFKGLQTILSVHCTPCQLLLCLHTRLLNKNWGKLKGWGLLFATDTTKLQENNN